MFLTEAANRGSISTGFNIDNSIKFEADNTEYLKWTDFDDYASDARKKKFSFSIWCKRTELGVQQLIWNSGANGYLSFEAGDVIKWQQQYGGVAKTLNTNRVFRDAFAWYHIILAVDSSQGTEANRVRLYINGVEETSFSSATYPSQNATADNVYGDYLSLGRSVAWGAGFNGYVADYLFVSEVQLVPTDVGEFDEDSGIWKPKAYGGTISTPSHFLEFQDGSDLGTATSGLDADTMNNITAADQATDTPTNNFCTLFPPPDAVTGTEPSIKEGGTTMFGGVSSTQNAFGTMGVRSGKWYFESTITNSGGVGTQNHNFGVIDPEQITYVMTSGRDIGASPAGWACASNSSPRNNNAAASGANATGALAVDKIMGVAIDMDNGKIWWHREGTWTSISSTAGDPANGTTPAFSNLLTATDNFVIPAGGFYVNDGNQIRVMNFGGYAQAVFTAVGTYTDANGYGSFAYQPPSGYYAICTKNLAEYG